MYDMFYDESVWYVYKNLIVKYYQQNIFDSTWFRFFLIRHGCWEIWKNVQNETTKPFSVGNTFL